MVTSEFYGANFVLAAREQQPSAEFSVQRAGATVCVACVGSCGMGETVSFASQSPIARVASAGSS